MPRIARIVVPDYPHHITQRGTNKTCIFHDDHDYRQFLKFLNECADKTNSEVRAYCLLTNHFHLLITPHSIESLGKCLHGATFRYAQYFNFKYNRTGRLWQNRYFSCPVDKDEYLWAVIRYIEMNPVRAGISKLPEDWQWSSAGEHIKGTVDNNIKLHRWAMKEERKDYINSSDDKDREKNIRKATSSGRPFGGDRFFEKLNVLLKRDLRPKKGGRHNKRILGNMGVVPFL